MTDIQDAIFRLFTDSSMPLLLSQREIASRIHAPLATTHRAIHRLIELGWLCECLGRVMLGSRIHQVAALVARQYQQLAEQPGGASIQSISSIPEDHDE